MSGNKSLKGIVAVAFFFSCGVGAANDDSSQDKLSPPIWRSNLYLGVQFLPNYNNDGENEGLDKSKPYGVLNIDSRWRLKKSGHIINTGADIYMLGTGAVKEGTDNQGNKLPSKFSEISDTVDSSIYFQFVHDRTKISPGSEIGFIARVGTITRDRVASDESTLNNYYKLGMKYTYFRGLPEGFTGIYNVSHSGYIDVSYANYSEYAGGNNQDRLVVDAQFQIIETVPWFFGIYSNSGKGADEFYLSMSFRAPLDKLVGAFSLPDRKVNEPELLP